MDTDMIMTYAEILKGLMGKKTYHLSKANALSEIGMEETAQSLYLAAAGFEEQIAVLLDSSDQELEAAIHRISAASCYKTAGNLNSAVNLFRAALSAPLQENTRNDVKQLLNECLQELASEPMRVLSIPPFTPATFAGAAG